MTLMWRRCVYSGLVESMQSSILFGRSSWSEPEMSSYIWYFDSLVPDTMQRLQCPVVTSTELKVVTLTQATASIRPRQATCLLGRR